MASLPAAASPTIRLLKHTNKGGWWNACGDVGKTRHHDTDQVHRPETTRSCAKAAASLAPSQPHGDIAAEALAGDGVDQHVLVVHEGAERKLMRSRPEDEPEWIRYFTPAYLADELAHCFHDLGRPQQTQQHLGDALTSLSPSHVRRLAIDTALLASSLAAAGRIDEACATGREAVDHAARTASHRCVQRIVDVQVDLDPYRGEPEVREFSDYVRHQLPAAVV